MNSLLTTLCPDNKCFKTMDCLFSSGPALLKQWSRSSFKELRLVSCKRPPCACRGRQASRGHSLPARESARELLLPFSLQAWARGSSTGLYSVLSSSETSSSVCHVQELEPAVPAPRDPSPRLDEGRHFNPCELNQPLPSLSRFYQAFATTISKMVYVPSSVLQGL